MQGDTNKARAGYNDFFTLGKDADSDIPILKGSQGGVREIEVVATAPTPAPPTRPHAIHHLHTKWCESGRWVRL
jgi:hypothetical protein